MINTIKSYNFEKIKENLPKYKPKKRQRKIN